MLKNDETRGAPCYTAEKYLIKSITFDCTVYFFYNMFNILLRGDRMGLCTVLVN